MPIRSNIIATIAASVALCVMPQASAITFNVNVAAGDATATGVIWGVIGNMSYDVSSPFDLTLIEELKSATVSSEAGGGQVAAGNSDAVTVTSEYVFFNYSDTNDDFVKFYTDGGSTFLCFQTYAVCGGTGAGIVIQIGGALDPFQPMTGNQIIASAAPVPELPTWTMALLCFSGLGLAGYCQNRAAQSV
jgi:hypothetical protein